MPTHAEKRTMPYSAKQMYDLVADIGAYDQFLPWISAVRIRSQEDMPDGQIVEADLVVSFKVFRERFGSRVTLQPDLRHIEVEYLEGPFKYLKNHWKFVDQEDGCEIDFFVDFEFKSRALQAVIGLVFNEAMQRIVRAFEERARTLYGPCKT